MFNQTIVQLETEIFGLKLQLQETELEVKRVKLEIAYLPEGIHEEEGNFYDMFEPCDYWYSLKFMEERRPELFRYRNLRILSRRLPEDCLSIFLEIEDKKAELSKLKEKNNLFSWLIQLANTMF